LKILLIEDEVRVADFIKQALEAENFSIDVENEGFKGYNQAIRNKYDLIILDLMLPGKDGLSILTDLRENDINTPILILTALSDVEDKVKGLNLGADDYLGKPFNYEELIARVKAMLRRKELNSIYGYLEYENLRLNTAKRYVEKNDSKIDLTVKEYELLEYLMRNKFQIISRRKITEDVWQTKSDGDSNLVDVYIKRLRSKIGKSINNKPIIRSIRGVGYSLGEPNVK
jgi:DNA-binding response OmpR family regulator